MAGSGNGSFHLATTIKSSIHFCFCRAGGARLPEGGPGEDVLGRAEVDRGEDRILLSHVVPRQLHLEKRAALHRMTLHCPRRDTVPRQLHLEKAGDTSAAVGSARHLAFESPIARGEGARALGRPPRHHTYRHLALSCRELPEPAGTWLHTRTLGRFGTCVAEAPGL